MTRASASRATISAAGRALLPDVRPDVVGADGTALRIGAMRPGRVFTWTGFASRSRRPTNHRGRLAYPRRTTTDCPMCRSWCTTSIWRDRYSRRCASGARLDRPAARRVRLD